MPAAQRVLRWPQGKSGLTALVDEMVLPFPDLGMDRAFLVHALECTDHSHPLLLKICRILSDSKRLIVVAYNRRGL